MTNNARDRPCGGPFRNPAVRVLLGESKPSEVSCQRKNGPTCPLPITKNSGGWGTHESTREALTELETHDAEAASMSDTGPYVLRRLHVAEHDLP